MAVINQVTRTNDPARKRERGLAGKPGTRRGTMSNRSKGFRRSAGTVRPLDPVPNRMRAPSQAAQAADIQAVDRGEGRTIACLFRGTYGTYPRRFKQKMLDLTSDSLVLRPFWYGLNRKRVTIAEPVLAAEVRERNFKTDWNVRVGVEYAPGRRLEWAGFVVISLPDLIWDSGVRRPTTRRPADAPHAPARAQPGAAGQRRSRHSPPIGCASASTRACQIRARTSGQPGPQRLLMATVERGSPGSEQVGALAETIS
jgi:hypothetical protein